MTKATLLRMTKLSEAHAATVTLMDALKAINIECEFLPQLVTEIAHARNSDLGITKSDPPAESTGEKMDPSEPLLYSPKVRDAIGYINIVNNSRWDLRNSAGPTEWEFLEQINPDTRSTLHMKRGFTFLVAIKNGRRWTFLPPVETLREVIEKLSIHKGQLRMVIHYTKS